MTLVLAHKDESTTTVHNKYGMSFPLDDVIQSKSEKSILMGVPGESAAVVLTETTTSSSGSAASAANEAVNNESVDGETGPTTTASSAKESDKDMPAEGAILIGSDEEDKSLDENDQRIVFIERLMGLHLTSPNESQGPENMSNTNGETTNDQRKRSKWESRTQRLPSASDNSPDSMRSQMDVQPHPMLRYAAAAMMSRLIAAAARAQMESQAREAAMLRGGAKDKDDDVEEESVPVLLASLRSNDPSEGMRNMRSSASSATHMYGRPSLPRSARGPLGGPTQRMSSVQHQRFVPPPTSQNHPLLQQLQALQVLSALQRMQRQRETVMSPESRPGEKGSPALVMVAIPIQSQESRQQAQQVYPQAYMQPQYRSYYPYAAPYATYPSYRPIAHPAPSQSYAMPIHAVPPPPSHYAYRPSPYSHAATYPTHALTRSQALHPAYSQVRPVIEVPVEVPIPYHVPVPVAAYPAQTLHAHGPHALPIHGDVSRGDADNSASDSDQIVLFYDAELQNDNENSDNSGNSNDDLQSSASEHRIMHTMSGKSHSFLSSGHQLPMNPSQTKLKLFREAMNQKYAARPGVRYLPTGISIGSSSEESQSGTSQSMQLQSRSLQGQESQPQPAFIVIADDGDQAVERRR